MCNIKHLAQSIDLSSKNCHALNMKYLIMLLSLLPLPVASDMRLDIVDSALQAATKDQNLPPRLLGAICFIESTHNPKAYRKLDGSTPSYGLCQIKLETAKLMKFKGHHKDLLKADINALYAAKYLRHQLDRYNGNVIKAISAYNAGSAGKHIKNTAYVKKVLNKLGDRHVLQRFKEL